MGELFSRIIMMIKEYDKCLFLEERIGKKMTL
jgi:hypothetical protein